MNNSLGTVLIVLAIAVLGCTLPTRQQETEPQQQPTVQQEDSSEETEALKEKIAELEKKRLEEKIEDLEERIDQQGKTTTTPSGKTTAKAVPRGFGRVNSPRDGFLALRSEPDVDRGYRITTIPHGKTIKVYSCGGRTVVNGRSGRWCQVVWRQDVGWVFDAYLIR